MTLGFSLDVVLEEPEAGRGVAAVVVAVEPGVQDRGGRCGVGVRGGVGVGDVVLGLRLGVGEQPPALLDAQGVLGAAAGEDVVGVGVDRVGDERGGDGGAGCALWTERLSAKIWFQSWEVVVEPEVPRAPAMALASSSKVPRRLRRRRSFEQLDVSVVTLDGTAPLFRRGDMRLAYIIPSFRDVYFADVCGGTATCRARQIIRSVL